jgi:hypothetical protein
MMQGECASLPGLGGGKAPASPLGGRDRAAKSTAIIEKMLSDILENHPFPCPGFTVFQGKMEAKPLKPGR